MASSRQEETTEWVVCVPKQLTQRCYQVLLDAECVARPWQFEGRNGSRIHEYNGQSAIPILKGRLDATSHLALLEILKNPAVSVLLKDKYVSNRRLEPPFVDARIHPERLPIQSDATSPRRPTDTSFTFCELFGGIGGFGVALEKLGGACVFCSEIDDSCRQVYQRNLKVADRHMHSDIYKVADEEFPASVDLLVAGFPCQPFSSLGDQPGFGASDGKLFLQIVRVLKRCKTKAFLLALKECGFFVHYEILDARGLTATSRKRLYIVGTTTETFHFPFLPDLQLRASDVLDYEKLCASQEALLHITEQQLEVLHKQCKLWKPAHLAWPNTVIQTLTSHYGNSVTRGQTQLVPGLIEESANGLSNYPRRFTTRECARIMGFPHWFDVPTKSDPQQGEMAFQKSAYRKFGNAVCPPLIAGLAGAVLDVCFPHQHWLEYSLSQAVELAYAATRQAPH